MAWAFRKSSPQVWPLPLFLGVIGAMVYFVVGDLHRVFFGLALAPLVLGLAMAERQLAYRLPASVLLLGAASYAIYLVHNPAQSLIARLLRGVDSWGLTFAACTIIGALLGVSYHLLFEKPALRFLSHRPANRN